MFERYTDTARRALFFARYEASEIGAVTITPELLLLGIARADKALIARLFGGGASADDIRRDIEGRMQARQKFSRSIEIPFDDGTKHALQFSAEEAERLRHRHIGPEHLMLGLLREQKSDAAAILTNHGLRLQQARATVANLVAEDATRSMSVEATETSSLLQALNHMLDRLSTLTADKAGARALLEEIRERAAALERQLGERRE